MYAGQDWSPLEPGETDTFSLSFINDLGTTETISSASCTLTLVPNTSAIDSSPTSRLNGSPSISGAVISQSITGCLAGAYYLLQMTANTSLSRVLQGYSRFQCVSAQ